MKLIKFAAPSLLALIAYVSLWATIVQPSSGQKEIATDNSSCSSFPIYRPCPF